MSSTNNNNFFIQGLENILQFLYNSYYDINDFVKEHKLYIVSVLPILILSILIYYLSFKNPYNIMDYIQSSSTIIYVLLTFFILTMLIYFSKNQNDFNTINPFIKYLKLIGIILTAYILISVLYFISKNVLYYGSSQSILTTIIVIICLMGIFYKLFMVQRNRFNSSVKKIYSTYDLLVDIIFYIPCLLIDFIEYFKQDYNNTPSSTFILSGIVLFILLFFYILPYVINYFKKDKGIRFLKEQSELNEYLVLISQKELRNEIIQSRPLLQRKVLHFSNKIDDHLNLYGNYFKEDRSIFDLSKLHDNRKYLEDVNNFEKLSSHEKCNNKKITCDASDNLLKCGDQRLEDVYIFINVVVNQMIHYGLHYLAHLKIV